MADPNRLPGKFIWFEHLSRDSKRAQAFYGEALGWRTQAFPMGDASYDMVYVGDTMTGGYATSSDDRPARWISYVSVENVDGAASAATASGGKIVEPLFDARGVGRFARIADPQGAELYLFKKATDDPADGPVTQGHFFWNELHTPDPAAAAAFYEKVVGFSHRSLDMGPAGAYHIVSAGGVDRGGITAVQAASAPPHWLPYVYVDDVDATMARVKKVGGTESIPPHDIPGIGRFAVLADPTGAELAVMKPLPRAQ